MLKRTIAIFVVAFALAGAAPAETNLPFALDWKFEGPAAPYFVTIDNGHFEASGLSVEISAGQGSLDAIPKVATGAFPVGFADINSLIKFLDQNPGAPVTAVMMIYDKPPFAIVGRKSLGVSEPKDLEGRILGAPPPDGAWAQFPAFASANDLDIGKITVEPVGFPTREPMLAEGNVAAVTGFSFSSFLNLVRLGVPEDDISTILMADHGLALYGNAIIVNTDFCCGQSRCHYRLPDRDRCWMERHYRQPRKSHRKPHHAQPGRQCRSRTAPVATRHRRQCRHRLHKSQRHGRH